MTARVQPPRSALTTSARENIMLILSRKVHQEIVIGDGISITIVAIRGKQVRVGIKAPPNVPIRRDELAPLEPAPMSGVSARSLRGDVAEFDE